MADEDEAAAAEAVDEEAVEKIAGDCDEVEEAEQEERRVPRDSQAGEELGLVVVCDERSGAPVAELHQKA